MKEIYLFLVGIVLVAGILMFKEFGLDVDEKKIEEIPDNLVPSEGGLIETETRVPIIMYHYVREVNKNSDPLGWNLSINPVDFEKQLNWLKEEGYKSVRLKDLVDGKVPAKAVVLTFDDGLEDFYTTALPLLIKYGFTASNSIVSGMIGSHEHMNEEQIKECIKAGIEITSHTVGHVDLAQMDDAGVRKEVVESRDFLEEKFGIEIIGFVYPSGKYNADVVRILEEEGYGVAVTTEYGEADLANDEMLLLPRVRVDNRDGFERFVKKMEELE